MKDNQMLETPTSNLLASVQNGDIIMSLVGTAMAWTSNLIGSMIRMPTIATTIRTPRWVGEILDP